MKKLLLEIKNLHKKFGKLEVLKGVNISVEKGEKIDLNSSTHIITITDQMMYKLPYQFGKEKYTYVVTALDRLQNESKPVKVKVKL